MFAIVSSGIAQYLMESILKDPEWTDNLIQSVPSSNLISYINFKKTYESILIVYIKCMFKTGFNFVQCWCGINQSTTEKFDYLFKISMNQTTWEKSSENNNNNTPIESNVVT